MTPWTAPDLYPSTLIAIRDFHAARIRREQELEAQQRGGS